MARDFTKNTANYIDLGTGAIENLISGAAAISVHMWINMDTTDTTSSSRNRTLCTIIDGTTTEGIRINIDNNTTAGQRKLRMGGRSVSTDSIQSRLATTDLSTGTWHSIGGVNNFTGDTITPYVNGSAENGGAATFGNNTFTTGTPTAGGVLSGNADPPTDSTYQFDGRICEFAIWTSDIGAAGFAQLAKGMSALFVSPSTLVLYMPIIGRYSPETDLFSTTTGTIVGTVANAVHPRIIYPQGSY